MLFLVFFWTLSTFLPSHNRAVTRFRAMVIGKATTMYETLFEAYFSAAAASGLGAPLRPENRGAAPGGGGRKPSFVSVTMDFESAQHNGFFQAISRVYGGHASDYFGRAIGCQVHFKRFLLVLVGNNVRDDFFVRMMAIRDVEVDGGLDAVRGKLAVLLAECQSAGEQSRANVLQWLLRTRSSLLAAFPKAAGTLGRTELLASSIDTNCCESLNRQTKQVILEKGARTLVEVIDALREFDERTMAATVAGPNASAHATGQVTRMVGANKRKQRTNAVPLRGQLPKSAGKKRKGTPASSAPAADASAELAALLAWSSGAAAAGDTDAQPSSNLLSQFQVFLSSQGGAAGSGTMGS